MNYPSNERGQFIYYECAMKLYIITLSFKNYQKTFFTKIDSLKDFKLHQTLSYQEFRMVKFISSWFGNPVLLKVEKVTNIIFYIL